MPIYRIEWQENSQKVALVGAESKEEALLKWRRDDQMESFTRDYDVIEESIFVTEEPRIHP